MSEIGQRVNKLRQERNLSQGDIAKAVGVHQTMISAIERGTKLPSVSLLVDLQNYFGASLLSVDPEVANA